jgi:hypothetical protein
MKTHPTLKTLALAAALAGSVGAAQAAEYQYHQRVKGLVKSASSEPATLPPPPCVDPRRVANGTISAEFCGHTGTQLQKSGALLFELSNQARTSWANACADSVLPSRSEMRSAMSLPGSNFKTDYNYWTRDSYSANQGWVILVRSNGVVSEGWSLKSNLFGVRCARQF